MPHITASCTNLEHDTLRQRTSGVTDSKKRQPPALLGPRILAHARRWHRLSNSQYVITWAGKPVTSIRRSWDRARHNAYLGEDVMPHILRDTRAT